MRRDVRERTGRLSVREWPSGERPRERFEALGPGALATAEILAIILATGAPGTSAPEVARELLARFGSLRDLAGRGVAELGQVRGVGRAKALTVLAALELGRRMMRERRGARARIRGPKDVYTLCRPDLQDLKQEVFRVLLLNGQNDVTRQVAVSAGSLTASLVHPREVFREAIVEAAAGLILVHNHPSGNPWPSPEDRRITEQLAGAGRLLGIPVLDHVIVGDGRYTSFAEAGLLRLGE